MTQKKQTLEQRLRRKLLVDVVLVAVVFALFLAQTFFLNFRLPGVRPAWYVLCYVWMFTFEFPRLDHIRRLRRALRNPVYLEKARQDENDERRQLIERLAWEGTGKLLSWALLAAMLVALPLARLELFWTCLAIYLLLWGSWQLLRRYYWERM